MERPHLGLIDFGIYDVTNAFTSRAQIVIEARRGEDYRSDVAIDDVTVAMGVCDARLDCDFEGREEADELCSYQIGEWSDCEGHCRN